MLMAGVHALASLSPALEHPEASLLPDLAEVRDVSVAVAAAVVKQAVEDGNAQDEEVIKVVKGQAEQGLEEYIKVCRARVPSRLLVMAGIKCRPRASREFNTDVQVRMWDAVYRPLELVD